jgi:hypothetical protein
MRINYKSLLDGKRDKDIEEPAPGPVHQHIVKYKPKKLIFKKLVRVAENMDYTVYADDPPFPHILPVQQKMIMPTLKRCNWNIPLFFSIFIHELTHMVPYESRMALYSKHEEEIICELTAIRFLETVFPLYFNYDKYEKTVNRLRIESLQYVKRWINKSNKSVNEEKHIDKKRLKELVVISWRRANYLRRILNGIKDEDL